jgi:hypothetical protein
MGKGIRIFLSNVKGTLFRLALPNLPLPVLASLPCVLGNHGLCLKEIQACLIVMFGHCGI